MASSITKEEPKIVIDHGSSLIRAGICTEDTPRILVGFEEGKIAVYHRIEEKYVLYDSTDVGVSEIPTFPITKGNINNWEDLLKIWHETIYVGLKVQTQELPVLIAEPSLSPDVIRVKTAEVMFEELKVPAIAFYEQAICSLYKHKVEHGVSVDIGHGMATVVPVNDLRPIKGSTFQFNLSGLDITEKLHSMVFKKNAVFKTKKGEDSLRQIKEGCYLAKKDMYNLEMEDVQPHKYVLPDGSSITLGQELITCSEILFQPQLNGMSSMSGIHEIIRHAIEHTPVPDRDKLYKNIILSGGTCKLTNFKDRLWEELESYGGILSRTQATMQCSTDPELTVWKGAALLASDGFNEEFWISKAEYDESGPTVLYSDRYRKDVVLRL